MKSEDSKRVRRSAPNNHHQGSRRRPSFAQMLADRLARNAHLYNKAERIAEAQQLGMAAAWAAFQTTDMQRVITAAKSRKSLKRS